MAAFDRKRILPSQKLWSVNFPTSSVPNVKSSGSRKGKGQRKFKAAFPTLLAQASDGRLVRLVEDAFNMLVSSSNVELEGYIVVSQMTQGAQGFGKGVILQLISNKTDSDTQQGRRSAVAVVIDRCCEEDETVASGEVRYKFRLVVRKDFGEPGAVLVQSKHQEPFMLKFLCLKASDGSRHVFPCNSWLSDQSGPRVFFKNKAYLPVDTPPGLTKFRSWELTTIRGYGTGMRLKGERIYDYDVYNDLGNPDRSPHLQRPVLGGSEQFPYPRRIRTGRPPTTANNISESVPRTAKDVYLPATELHAFPDGYCGDADSMQLEINTAYASKPGFESFNELQNLFVEGLNLRPNDAVGCYLKFPKPQVIKADFDAWMLDCEFARQMIAGLNPLVIEALKVFPPKSSLYPSHKSPLSEFHIQQQLEGLTIQEALNRNRMFILDYYDAYMPYLKRINSQKTIQAYASRTILFLTSDGCLRPVAIELSLPGKEETEAVNRVFIPPATTARTDWLWELAKSHVSTNDAAYHQGISHWLRSHAVLEPFIIALHRQLSDMHPIKSLLLPHCKCTLAINSEARRILVSADGIIERTFFTGKYTAELTSSYYKHSWRFDLQGLPADLLKRGMAVKDPSSRFGLRLTIEDYPYAVDGLEIWESIACWVDEYVDIYYKYDVSVCVDSELQSWWTEAVQVGHADKKEGWPELKGKESLKEILTTVIWLASAHHAAVNFGQYAYAGYVPNRPTITHKLVPELGSQEYERLVQDPEKYYCSMLATKMEAVTLLGAIAVLSSHFPGEEYLGERSGAEWECDERVLAAFDRFSQRIEAVEERIELRNRDPELKNRRGPVDVPFTLLAPSSPGLGITGRGVPNSVSI